MISNELIADMKTKTPIKRMVCALEHIRFILLDELKSDELKELALDIGKILEPTGIWRVVPNRDIRSTNEPHRAQNM